MSRWCFDATLAELWHARLIELCWPSRTHGVLARNKRVGKRFRSLVQELAPHAHRKGMGPKSLCLRKGLDGAREHNPDDFIIREYHDDDIEDVVIIDEYGDVISETGTERSSLITEHLAMGILSTEKKLIYGVLNSSKFGTTGYVFVAGDDSDCLEDVGCFPEDIELADAMDVGGVMTAGYREDGSVLIIKMKDDRENHQ